METSTKTLLVVGAVLAVGTFVIFRLFKAGKEVSPLQLH